MLTADQEKELVEACKTNPAAFEKIYDEYYSQIFGYILHRVGDYDTARDVSSETFLKAYTSIHRFVWKEVALSSWLYRIATNEVNSFFRRRRYPLLGFLDIRGQFEAEYPDPASLESEKQEVERQLEEHQMYVRVQKIVQRLPPKYQAVIALRFFEQKSIKEISEIVGKKEGTVKSLLSRGLERIRTSLEQPNTISQDQS
ncbi:MAG: polymerase sigma factor [Bacteroidetes bacterium]|nr:polymerase sigma factor [Bacteroidota bacterium]